MINDLLKAIDKDGAEATLEELMMQGTDTDLRDAFLESEESSKGKKGKDLSKSQIKKLISTIPESNADNLTDEDIRVLSEGFMTLVQGKEALFESDMDIDTQISILKKDIDAFEEEMEDKKKLAKMKQKLATLELLKEKGPDSVNELNKDEEDVPDTTQEDDVPPTDEEDSEDEVDSTEVVDDEEEDSEDEDDEKEDDDKEEKSDKEEAKESYTSLFSLFESKCMEDDADDEDIDDDVPDVTDDDDIVDSDSEDDDDDDDEDDVPDVTSDDDIVDSGSDEDDSDDDTEDDEDDDDIDDDDEYQNVTEDDDIDDIDYDVEEVREEDEEIGDAPEDDDIDDAEFDD